MVRKMQYGKGGLFRPLFSFFRSTRLTLVLIVCIAAVSIIGTLVPQGERASHYINAYPSAVADTIIFFGIDRISRSLLAIIPVAMMLLNLAACTAHRLYRQLRFVSKKRLGPDIIHIALILLILGGYISVSQRTSVLLYLAKGETATISPGLQLYLKDTSFSVYEDGRSKQWISYVEILDSSRVIEQESIEINRPMTVGKGKLYLYDRRTESSVALVDVAGTESRLTQGSLLWLDQGIVRYLGNTETGDTASARFTEYGRGTSEVQLFAEGAFVGGYRVAELISKEHTGFMHTVDPGAGLVFLALAMLAAGLMLTIIQRMKDRNI